MKEFENMKQRLKPMLDWYLKIRSPSTDEVFFLISFIIYLIK